MPRSGMLRLKNKIDSCAGVDVAALSCELQKSQSCFLRQTRCSTARNQAQNVEQQHRHGCASVTESHLCGGPLGLAAGSTTMLAPPVKHVLYRSSRRLRGPVLLLLGTCKQQEDIPTHSTDYRLCVAILHFAETGISPALPAPPLEARPASINRSRAGCCCACS